MDFLTPVGRLVQGDCFEPQTKNQAGMPLLDKMGQPTQKYFVGVAFAKNDPAFAALKAQMEAIARAKFPSAPTLFTKIVDGDGIDNNGRPNNTKEGFAGHWILRASSTYPPKCFAAGKYGAQDQLQVIAGNNPIPRGHYVRIAGTCVDNGGGNGKPGLYVNCNMIEWSRIGDVIISGPDAATVFGGAQPAAPQAALPPGPTAPLQVTPHTAILTGPQMTPKAGAFTYAQYIAVGYDDAKLIAEGLMLPPPSGPVGSAAVPTPPAPAAPTAPAVRTPEQRFIARPDGLTYASYRASNWTDQQMLDNGLLAPA